MVGNVVSLLFLSIINGDMNCMVFGLIIIGNNFSECSGSNILICLVCFFSRDLNSGGGIRVVWLVKLYNFSK